MVLDNDVSGLAHYRVSGAFKLLWFTVGIWLLFLLKQFTHYVFT